MLSFHTEHANCILNNFQKSFTNFKHLPLLSWKCTSKKKKEKMTETLFTLAWKSLSANAVQKVCQSVLCLFLCQCLQPWANYLAWGELRNSPTPQLPVNWSETLPPLACCAKFGTLQRPPSSIIPAHTSQPGWMAFIQFTTETLGTTASQW